MNKVLIIGAGGVGSVVAHKCAMVPEVFGEITLASRTVSKCDAIAAEVMARLVQTFSDRRDEAGFAAVIALLGRLEREAMRGQVRHQADRRIAA